MSRSLGQLTVDLVLRNALFQQGMDKSARESERTLKRIQATARGIGTALAAGFAALGASNVIGAIVRNSIEAEDALKQLDARIKSTGGVAGLSSNQLTDFAQSMSEVTTFSDDAIVSMQSLLLTFTNISGQKVFGATEAILDLAAALGTDLPSAAQTVGRALNDPVRGITQLRRSGVQFTEDQERLIKALVRTGDVAGAQGIILEKLETQYGGAARAAASTFGGSLKQLENAFGDLLETDGGLNEATAAIQEFTALLRDPQTVAGAQSLTSAIIQAFAGATEAITTTVNTVRFLGEEFAAARFGAAADDVVRLQEQLALVQEMRNSSVFSRVRFFGKDGLVEWYSDAELDAEMATLKLQIDEATSGIRPPLAVAAGPSASPGAAPTALPDSEEFLKISGQLHQQISLYGQVGEAAKIRYQIESGALDELSASEQQRVLRLAEQYDAVVEAAGAAKELEQANLQLQKAYESQVGTYEQQIALTGEVTELQRLRFAIEQGGLEGVTEAQAAYLEGLAIEIDRQRELAEANAAREEQTKLYESQADQYQRQIDRVSDLSELEKLRYEFANGELATLDEGQRKVLEGLAAQTDAVKAVIAEEEKAAAARERSIENLQRNTQDILADALTNGFEEGADGVLKAFGKMLQQMGAQAVAAQITEKLFSSTSTGSTSGGGGGGGGGWGWVGDLFAAFAGGFASGGTMNPGEWGIVGERGPELAYAGSAPLNIKPMTGSTSVNNNFVIQTPTGRVPLETQQQMATRVGLATKRALGRNS